MNRNYFSSSFMNPSRTFFHFLSCDCLLLLFPGSGFGASIYGAWSESHDVLGIVDDTHTVYFFKANGEEITRFTNKHLKVSLPIIGLIAQDETDVQRSCL